jgi:preprotein translocase subunit SecF
MINDETSEFYSRKSTRIILVSSILVVLFLFVVFYNGFNFNTGFMGGMK